MAYRTTQQEVQSLLAPLADDVDVSIFQRQANILVEEELANLVPTLSTDRLWSIEVNLAAHFCVVALERGGLSYQKRGASEEGYQRVGGGSTATTKLSSTRFGQQAIALDSSGTLSNFDAPGTRAEFRVSKADYDSYNPSCGG